MMLLLKRKRLSMLASSNLFFHRLITNKNSAADAMPGYYEMLAFDKSIRFIIFAVMQPRVF
jgi:hypothetical protein